MKPQLDVNLLLPSPNLQKRKLEDHDTDSSLLNGLQGLGSPKRYAKVVNLMEQNAINDDDNDNLRSPVRPRKRDSSVVSGTSAPSTPKLENSCQSTTNTPKSATPRRKLQYISSPSKFEETVWQEINLDLKPKVYGKSPRKVNEPIDLSNEIYTKIIDMPTKPLTLSNSKVNRKMNTQDIQNADTNRTSILKTYSDSRSYLLENDPFIDHQPSTETDTISISELKQIGQNNIIREEIEYLLENLTSLSSEEFKKLHELLLRNSGKFFELSIILPKTISNEFRPILKLLLTKKLINVNEKLIKLIKDDDELMGVL